MKKRNYGFIIAIVAVAVGFLALVGVGLSNKKSSEIDLDKYDLNAYIEGNEDNGGIADHVKGDLKTAEVVLFEYADFQCPGCASSNPNVNKLLEKYDGKVAIIYRNFLLSYHKNGTAAASAAEAAGLQGYWKDYADMLFANQSTWENASGDERTDMFVDLFREVTDGEGDLAKFEEDMGSEAVSKKLSFDQKVGKKVGVEATPAFYVDGEYIDYAHADSSATFEEFYGAEIDKRLK